MWDAIKRNLLGQPAPKSNQDRTVLAVDASSVGFTGRRRHMEVVGEFYRQKGFDGLVPRNARGNVNIATIAALVPDPAHKDDPNAVEVRIDGHHVGYLSKQQAVGYHQLMADAGHPGRALGNIEARIFGSQLDRDGNGGYGVALY